MRDQCSNGDEDVDEFGRSRGIYGYSDSSGRDKRPDREQNRSRRSPPHRSDSRDRTKGGRSDRDDARNGVYGPAISKAQDTRNDSQGKPNQTLVIKGLSAQTTEIVLSSFMGQFNPRGIRLVTRDGESKRTAFVDFHSVDQAELFMKMFAGSAGDPNAAQLIIENRAVQLEFAREFASSRISDRDFDARERLRDPPRHTNGYDQGDRRGNGDGGHPQAGLDWICSTCKGQNFSRRSECYRCAAQRTSSCITVPRGAGGVGSVRSEVDGRGDELEAHAPGAVLVVRGLHPIADEQQVVSLFRPFALVKNVNLLRDPYSNLSTNLAYVEFYSVEHAQYALTSYRDATRGTHGGRGRDAPASAAFAETKSMLRLQREASQPGSSLASNPLVMQALQAAQWSAQVGMPASSTTTDPGGFAPSHAYPAMPYVQPPVLSIPHVATPYFAVPGAADPFYGAASAHQQYAQYPLYNGCPGTQEYLEVHQQQLPVMVKPAVRWPPLFETNGGAYVFQAKTGCFLDPTTDFFYDPRAKLYYSGRDGGYYCHDPALSPPFRAFVPPEPTAAYSAHPLPALPLDAPLGLLASAGRSLEAQQAAAVPAAAPVATKVKLGLSGGIKLGGAVGFGGFGLPTSKKVKVDIAKWGALQEDNEDEGKEEGATKAKEKKDESSRDAARVRQAQGPMEGTTKVGSKRPLEDTARAVTGSVSQTTGPPPPPPRAGLPPAFVAPPLPPLPPPAARASPPVPPAVVPASTVATEPATPAKPVCLLCQRQFPSFEMLQRHEKESKLHADNLKKSLGLM